MKKVLVILAFAFVASFGYTAYAAVQPNTTIVERLDEKPKKQADQSSDSSEAKSSEKKECTKSEKSGCSKEQKSACSDKK